MVVVVVVVASVVVIVVAVVVVILVAAVVVVVVVVLVVVVAVVLAVVVIGIFGYTSSLGGNSAVSSKSTGTLGADQKRSSSFASSSFLAFLLTAATFAFPSFSFTPSIFFRASALLS